MNECRICSQPQFTEVLSFGSQPVSHRFVESNKAEATYPLALGLCEACGVVQLVQPMPLEMIIPRYDWMKHVEPEAHLPAMAERIAALPGVSQASRILGVFEHDEPLLAQLRDAGFHHAEKIDPVRDLDLSEGPAGAAIMQSRINRIAAERIVGTRGHADVVISRRVLEHAYEPAEFLLGLRSLTHQTGHIVIEVPDCQQAFEQVDVATVWEEHTAYFTRDTLRTCFASNGLRLTQLDVYPYPLENCLVGTAQPLEIAKTLHEGQVIRQGHAEMAAFAERIESLRNELHRFLTVYRNRGGRIAWLGAGHRSCVYINVMQLGDFLDCVIDDDQRKQQLGMPGSQLPICSPQVLDDPQITLCILCINPAAEDYVISKNKQFMERGGTFASVSPGSSYSVRL